MAGERDVRITPHRLALGAALAAAALALPGAAAAVPPPAFLFAFGSSGAGPGQFDAPADVAFDPVSGFLYVVDSANHRVQKLGSDGTFVDEWGSPGILDGDFAFPQGIAVNPLTGDVYVADTANSRIQKFDANGNHLATYGGPLPVPATFLDLTDGFVVPSDIAVNPITGKVYVADSGNNRIMRFDSDLGYEDKWGLDFGLPGTGDGEFVFPTGVAVDFATGQVYVTDNGSDRVQRFTSGGSFISEWGSSGSGDGELSGPNGPSVLSGGTVYVADSNNDRIQAFGLTGAFLAGWGSSGSANAQFDDPTGTAVTPSERVYVADSGNDRIQVFGPSPAVLVVDDDGYATSGNCDAGFPNFAFTSIQAAVDFALPNDTISVCPGLYPEHVTVSKRLILTGPGAASPLTGCNAPAAADPLTQAIVRGSTLPGTATLSLAADGLVVEGLVVESAADGPGIATSAARSGYVIRKNFIQGNQGGVLLDSSGSYVTSVRANCIRQNNDPGGDSGYGVRSATRLGSAKIESNSFFGNGVLAVSLEGTTQGVSVLSNKSRGDGSFAFVRGSTSSRVVANIAQGQAAYGIQAAAGNSRLEIRGNIVQSGGGDGIRLTGFPTNTRLVLAGNIVQSLTGNGILVDDASSSLGTFQGNIVQGNGADGIKIKGTGNAANTLTGNIAQSNTPHDCHDSTAGTRTAGTANTWSRNLCRTQNRAGLAPAALTAAPVHPATH